MKTREEAARFAEALMKDGLPSKRKSAWHFGKVELRDLFDFIYGGPPTSQEEALFEPLRLRNAKVGKWRDCRVMQQEADMSNFINPSWIKTSEYPQNFLPSGNIAIDQASEDGDYTMKGFYDPKTGEYHIQEVVHKAGVTGAELAKRPR